MKYEINGKVIETASALSDAEIDEIASTLGGGAQEPQQVQATPGAKFYEIEKQQGLPPTPEGKLKQFGQDFLEAAKSPVPGSLITAPVTSAQKFASQAGADVARKTDSRLAGMATQIAGDPTSYIGIPGANLVKKAFSGVGKAGNGILKTVMKIGANVSDSSIEQGAKAGWKLPNVSAAEIEVGVANVQKALQSAVDDAGGMLNKAKSDLGLPVTAAEKESSLLKNKNIFGLGKEEINAATQKFIEKHTDAKSLVNDITEFKSGFKDTEPKLRAKIAMALQDQINDFVNWEKSGNQVEGLLKHQYKELGDMVQSVMPKQIRERMKNALSLKDDLGKALGLGETEGTGKAEQFLRSLFEGKSARSKDYLKRLADLEVMTGQPVLQELFKKFAGQDLSKLAGRPFLAATAAGAALFNPVAAGLLVGQSPKALSAIGRTAGRLSGVAEGAANVGARGLRGFGLGQMSEKNKAELDRLNARLRNAQ